MQINGLDSISCDDSNKPPKKSKKGLKKHFQVYSFSLCGARKYKLRENR